MKILEKFKVTAHSDSWFCSVCLCIANIMICSQMSVVEIWLVVHSAITKYPHGIKPVCLLNCLSISIRIVLALYRRLHLYSKFLLLLFRPSQSHSFPIVKYACGPTYFLCSQLGKGVLLHEDYWFYGGDIWIGGINCFIYRIRVNIIVA